MPNPLTVPAIVVRVKRRGETVGDGDPASWDSVVCDHACVPVRGPLRAHRYVGLAGSAALAAGAYKVGALPGLADADAVPARADAAGVLVCLGGLVALTVAWWRIGAACVRPGGPALTGRWMLTTAALWAVPALMAPPLASRDVYAYACHGALIQAELDPHQATPVTLPCPWLDSVPPIWRAAPSPYGPLFGMLSAGAAELSGGRVAAAVAAFRVLAVAGVLLATWCGRGLAVACGVGGPRAAWLGLASPLVTLHAISGAHNDALMAGLVLAAFALAASAQPGATARAGATSRRRTRAVGAGLVLGLAVAVKATALVALPFVVVLLLRAPRGWRALARASVEVAASVVLAYAVLGTVSGLGLGFRHGLARTGELAQWTSVPTAVGMSVGYAGRALGVDSGQDVAIAVARLGGMAVAAALVAAAWLAAWRAPADPASGLARRAVLGGGLAFAAVAWLGPVSYPWYGLTPLALLAVSTADDRARAWLGVACATLAFLILPDGVGLAGRTKSAGALVVTATVTATVVVLTVRWLRAVPRRPTATGS